MTDTEQNHTPSSNEIKEKDYAAISEKADDLFNIGKEEEGIRELKKGLAIVKKFIELHNGRIRETGSPGKSARFEILLPRKECKEAAKT